MAIFTSSDHLPEFENTVLTIGSFDGVHIGHRAILKEVVSKAREIGGQSVLLTFEPHPRKLIFPTQTLNVLTPLDTKLQLITAAGIEHIVVQPFDHEFSSLSAEDYVLNFLVKNFNPHTVIIGYDHHFGHDRKGNIDVLKSYGTLHNFRVEELSARLIDDAAVSSTKVRTAIRQGKVNEAQAMLGRPYSLKGRVIHGQKLGRKLGYPTANIKPGNDDQLIPAIGIYAVKVNLDGQFFGGMMSIGKRPTVSEDEQIHLEVNLFDFDKDIYGHLPEIEFIDYLRDELKFENLEDLKKQIADDEHAARSVLKLNR